MTPSPAAGDACTGDSLKALFIRQALSNANNRAILERLQCLALPDAWLVAGCLFQTVWNLQDGRAPTSGIKDYDLFYFDSSDLSEEAELNAGKRVEQCFVELGIAIEVKNQARVHTWYPQWCGLPYAALTSSRDGIDRFLVRCTCVALKDASESAESLYAPYGLRDLYKGVLRPNALIDHRTLFREKAASYRSRWPRLRIDETEISGFAT